jgi:tetratricopeptide (TPR) repeat protein
MRIPLIVFCSMLLSAGSQLSSADDCAPPDAVAAFEFGQEFLQTGFIREGAGQIEQAVHMYPDFIDAWKVLHQIYSDVGQFDEAIRAAKSLKRLEPGMAESYDWQIRHYRSMMATPAAAVQALENCRGLETGSEEAIAACEEAVRIYPDYVDARYFLGVEHIYAGDEKAAKEQIAALILLDPDGATPTLIHAMAEIKPDWFDDAYQQELATLFAASKPEDAPIPRHQREYRRFSDDEVATILVAYKEQIAEFRSFLDGLPEIVPEDCSGYPSKEAREELKQRFEALSITHAYAERQGCPTHKIYMFLNEEPDPLALTEITKIGADENWRIGLRQHWVSKQYCKPTCSTSIEFRIDTEFYGDPFKFQFRTALLEKAAEACQCFGNYGDSPLFKEW